MSFFEEYDKKYNFKNYKDKLKKAKKLGFDSFTEFVIYAYKKSHSMNDTAKRCDLTFGTVKNILNNLPEDIKKINNLKIRKRGGLTRSKLNSDDVKYIRSKRFMNLIKFIKLAKELSEKKSKELGIEINIDYREVEKCYNKKTHKNI